VNVFSFVERIGKKRQSWVPELVFLKNLHMYIGWWYKRVRGEGEMGGFRGERNAQNLNRWIKF